jgi:hypothetical protein
MPHKGVILCLQRSLTITRGQGTHLFVVSYPTPKALKLETKNNPERYVWGVCMCVCNKSKTGIALEIGQRERLTE